MARRGDCEASGGGIVGASALPVDEVGEGFRGDPPQPADINGVDLAVGEQLVQQAAADAEAMRGLADR